MKEPQLQRSHLEHHRGLCPPLAFLLLLGPVLPAYSSLDSPVIERLPFQIPAFDSGAASAEWPRVFISRAEIERARSRIESEPPMRAIRDRFVAAADAQLAVEIVPIDESWWQAAKDKPWGETYPPVFEHTSLVPGRYARTAVELALAWSLTGDAKYADQAVAMLLNLAPYSFEPVHYDVGMNYAVWGLPMLRAYEILLPRLSADQRRQIDACFTRMARAVARNDIYWMDNNIGGGINNHLAWHKTMLGLLGLAYERPEMVDFCLHGRRGLVPLLADGLLDDGLWCESSLTYQFAAIAPMIVMADAQKRLGQTPGLHEISAANGRTLKQSYDAMINVLAPDLLIPPIGDAYGARQKLWKITLYEYCWALWQDPAHAWLIRQNPEPSSYLLTAPPLPADPPSPPIGTLLQPEHGYAFLRSHRDGDYWNNPDARMAFLTYDRSSVHANADKLNLMLFGQGRMLLSDVEGVATLPHAFSSRIQGELNRGGLSQNTVMIDGRDQRCGPEMLDLLEFHDLPDEKRVTAADRRGLLYEGVRQMRTVAMTPDYILDVFQVDCGETPRQIDWLVHIMDDKASAPADRNPTIATAEPFAFSKTGPWPWLRDARTLLPKDPIELEWHAPGARLRLQMLDPGAERLILCGYPATDKPDSGTIPMVLVRKQDRRAVFAAIWLVGDTIRAARLERRPDHDNKLVFAVTADDHVRLHLLPRLEP